MKIRKMTAEDIPAAADADSAAFESAWDEDEFSDELKKDYSHYVVIENDGKIYGYAGIWCIYETAELIRIAVNPDMQKKGLASLLMDSITAIAKEKGCEHMLLEVRLSNEPAKALYKKSGFTQIDLRRGYYNGEDAVIMERIL